MAALSCVSWLYNKEGGADVYLHYAEAPQLPQLPQPASQKRYLCFECGCGVHACALLCFTARAWWSLIGRLSGQALGLGNLYQANAHLSVCAAAAAPKERMMEDHCAWSCVDCMQYCACMLLAAEL
jgi:hypothetical protein